MTWVMGGRVNFELPSLEREEVYVSYESSYETLHSIYSPKDDIRDLDTCVECRFRPEGIEHQHHVMAGILQGQEHRAWFDPNHVGLVGILAIPDDVLAHRGPLCGDPLYSSWNKVTYTDGRTFMHLTIDRMIYVWKLTDEIDPVNGRVLGLWPD